MGGSGWVAVAVVGGVVIGCLLPSLPWLTAGVLVGGIGVCLLFRSTAAYGVLGLALGLGSAQARPLGPVIRGPVAVQGRVIGAPIGRVAVVGLTRVGTAADGWRSVGGTLRVRTPGRAPPPGTELLGWGQARPVTARALPGGAHSDLGQLLGSSRSEVDLERWEIVDPVRRPPLPPGRHGGVLHALAWGDRSAVDPALVGILRRTGTVHLLSISGFHVGLVAVLVGGAVDRLLRVVGLWRARGVWRGWALVLGAMAGVAYSVAAGSPVGAIRAAMVLCLLAFVRLLGAKARGLDVLVTVAAAVALVDPGVVLGPSFQLSFGAVLGLVRLMPVAAAWRPRWWPRWLGWMWTSGAATICATAGTLPALGWWFQEVAALPVFANLVAVPVVSLILVPLAALHALGLPGTDGAIGWATDGVVDGLVGALAVVDWPPLVLAWGPSGALALALAVWVHRREAWLVAVLVCGAPGPGPPARGLRVTVAEVGAGSAVLAEWADGRTWLIDGGPRAREVLHWLRRRGVRRLDVVAASQGRADHARGLVEVVRHLSVGELWLPPNSRHDPDLIPLVQAALQAGVPVVPNPSANLAGEARQALRSEADRGLALSLESGDWSILLPSDLGPAGLGAVGLEAPPQLAAVLMPGHGGARGADASWLGERQPRVAVAQSGRWERYPRPHPRALAAWADRAVPVLRTDLDGTVELWLTPDRVAIRTWRWDRGWRRLAPRPLAHAPWRRAGIGPNQGLRDSEEARSSMTSWSSSNSSSSSMSSSSEPLRSSMNR